MHVTAPWKDQDPPVLPLRSGQKIHFTSEWQNFTDGPVRAGVNTTDEMCFILGYYWREDEGVPIRGPGCFPTKEGILCPTVATVESTTTP